MFCPGHQHVDMALLEVSPTNWAGSTFSWPDIVKLLKISHVSPIHLVRVFFEVTNIICESMCMNCGFCGVKSRPSSPQLPLSLHKVSFLHHINIKRFSMKHVFSFVAAVMLASAAWAQTTVTLTVDMSNEMVSADGVHVAGKLPGLASG